MKEILKCLLVLLFGMTLGAEITAFIPGSGRQNSDGAMADTTNVYDTIRVYKPVPRDSAVIRYITQTVPTEEGTEDMKPDGAEPMPGITVEITSGDSAKVNVPITQKRYETEDYRAYVSGYQPSLDSLFITKPTQIVRITEKPSRWGIGISAGYGIGTKGLSPYIGVGVVYRIWDIGKRKQ